MDKLTFMYRSVLTHAYRESDLDSAGGALDLSPRSSQPCMTAAERAREMGRHTQKKKIEVKVLFWGGWS